MLKKDDHYLLGSLFKSIGTKGEILVKSINEIPEKINKMESVFVEIDGKLVPFFIDFIKVKSSNSLIIKFEGINEEQKSQEFLGSDLYLDSKNKKIIDELENDFIDVVGYSLKDQNNIHIGEILEYIDISGNPLLRIQTPKNEILVPAHDDLIIEVDDDEKYIIIQLAEGIIDLEE